jgi:hypothetical protein
MTPSDKEKFFSDLTLDVIVVMAKKHSHITASQTK